MKDIGLKVLKIAAVAVAGILVIRLVGPKLAKGVDRMFEEAPDDFPPKWMFLNITAIRENTERILEALAHEPTRLDSEVA
jgi:hypothetical protein